jgi:cytoskeletal protein CcmA (bactofilin family)
MVKVHDAVINGCVEGDLKVEYYLELQVSARVAGNITYRTLKLDCRATVDGKLVRMGDDAAAAGAGGDVEPKALSFAKALDVCHECPGLIPPVRRTPSG